MKEKPIKIKKEKVIVPGPKLISYSMKAVIATGAYCNIQPEIIVEASSLEAAQDYVLPHIELLFKKYLNFNERKPEPFVPVATSVYQSTEFYSKAYNAVIGCSTVEALSIITTQIAQSTRLTDPEKAALKDVVAKKALELKK